MSESTDSILVEIDQMLDGTSSIFLAQGKGMVAYEELEQQIDKIRMTLPGQIEQAKAIVKDRNSILAETKYAAGQTIHEAEERAKRIVDSNTVQRLATNKASTIISEANNKANEMISDAEKKANAAYQSATDEAKQQVEKAIRESRKRVDDATTEAREIDETSVRRAKKLRDDAYRVSKEMIKQTDYVISKSLYDIRMVRDKVKELYAKSEEEK